LNLLNILQPLLTTFPSEGLASPDHSLPPNY